MSKEIIIISAISKNNVIGIKNKTVKTLSSSFIFNSAKHGGFQ